MKIIIHDDMLKSKAKPLSTKHNRIAKLAASVYGRRYPQMDRRDLYQQAWEIMLEGERRYNPEKGDWESYMKEAVLTNLSSWIQLYLSPLRAHSHALEAIRKVRKIPLDHLTEIEEPRLEKTAEQILIEEEHKHEIRQAAFRCLPDESPKHRSAVLRVICGENRQHDESGLDRATLYKKVARARKSLVRSHELWQTQKREE